jgi:tetratricopeptide (TPR) repeat protein
MNTPFLCWATTGLACLALIDNAAAAESCQNTVGKFVSIEGAIEIEHTDQGQRLPASLESSLCQDDLIYVGENSRATVGLINEVVLRLDQNTTMRLVDVASQPEKRSVLELLIGAFKSFSRPPRTFAVNTPYLNGLIEGTEFAMRVEGDSSMTTVYEGKVTTSNPQGKLTLKRGESALAKAGKAPQPYVMVKPRDAVQWTLHYPPLFAALGGARQMPADASPSVKQALGSAAGGNTSGALAQLERIPSAEQNANYHLYRAALFLNVGRVGEARADINKALAKDPKAGLAYALLAIIEVVQNERPQALASAEKAVALTPSAATKIALSYAQQADFRLEAARDTLLSAVKEHPEDSLAWARLGEMWLMFGERGKALEAARKAEALAPGLSRTQTVLGFAALADNRESDSKTAFERAISLSSDDPLAHFGLGLTKIKHGDLKEGRKELEAAVALDSSNALLRSYLGKAYYEEKRSPLDEQQYSIAKELDPADPTPYFYDAIEKQTTNRPVEAMQDIQKAIELNNNRAVYRSRQLLDSDLAARSASLGRVYTDLGFQELALREGWKSVNIDPSNFSAHRFLADSYSALPRHEIARVSELLQSQLLQPLNMTPIQPRLAESNLFLISSGGPGGLSFNEFNPIFNRDGVTFQASGLVGEHSTGAGEGIVSGIYKKASFSLGYSGFETNGFRENNDQKDDIANAFFQYEFTPKTSAQFEYRYRNIKTGDLQLNFFQDDFLPELRTKAETQSYRAGLRHAFSPDSVILGSFMYSHRDEFSHDEAPPVINAIDIQTPDIGAYSGELQHLFRSQYVNITSGVGHFDISRKQQTAIKFIPDLEFLNQSETVNLDTGHTNVYLYSYINPLNNLTVTLGGSGDFFRTQATSSSESKDQFNPKFGITWNVLPATTLRAAVFRVLKRTLITNQTLEPTQVAGFNQFYDDIETTDAWRYGVAVDQKFSRTVFGGIELSRRDLDVPIPFIDPFSGLSELRGENWSEDLGRAYLFWTPHDWLAFSAEYQYEYISRGTNLNFGIDQATTQRIPLGIRFFHPSGVSLMMKATYFDQEGDFRPRYGNCCEHGRSGFWVADAALSYRLPKRYGFFTIGATNIFNENFRYQETDFNNPTIQPDRVFFGRLTLAFP